MVTRLDGRVAVRVARPEDEDALTRLDAAAWTPASGFPSVAERVNDPFFTFFTGDSPPKLTWWPSWTAGWPATSGWPGHDAAGERARARHRGPGRRPG